MRLNRLLTATTALWITGGILTALAIAESLVSSQDRALFEAAESGNLNEISDLLRSGANVNAAIPGDGSPLIGAARRGRLEAVRLLLDHRADPNLPVSGDGNALIMAASFGRRDVVNLLLDRGAKVDEIVPGDENPLITAAAKGHLDIVQLLVARGANVNARAWEADAYGHAGGEWRTPLNMARRNGHREVATYLQSTGARE